MSDPTGRGRPRVSLLMLETGGGHRAPALAIEEALHRVAPDAFDAEVQELARASGAERARRHIHGAWDFALSHPWSARASYRLVESLRPLVPLYLPWMLRELVDAGTALLARERPTVVMSTHYLCTGVALRARRRLGAAFPIVQFVTEPFDAFHWWAAEDADLHCVSSARAREMLIARGVARERVLEVPFPVARRFLVEVPAARRAALRAGLGLADDRPTVLFSLGAQGIGDPLSVVEALHARGVPCDLLCVTGKNEPARRAIEAIARRDPRSPTRVHALGEVANMHELLAVSTLALGKAGASSTMEALATGTPIVFTACAAQNEAPNIDWCARRGVGWYAPEPERCAALVERLLQGPALAQARARLRDAGLSFGAEPLARVVASLARDASFRNLPSVAA